MPQGHSALIAKLDALRSTDAGAVFAELIRAGLQHLMVAETTASIGAGRYQRTYSRVVHRNGPARKRCRPPRVTSRCEPVSQHQITQRSP